VAGQVFTATDEHGFTQIYRKHALIIGAVEQGR
jgi:hypothetical protein